MKRLMIALVLICAAALMAKLPAGPCSAAAETKADWTVLFYMCGSDLESRYGYATENLRDIGGCYGPRLLGDERLEEALAQHLDLSKLYDRWVGSAVNVLIQTGGCREWHASELGMDIATGALQRWRYRYGSDVGKPGRFTLEQALPLSSMSSPETLSDFIRWGVANYPAEKYAIVLWDHGGGSKTGLFIDELYAGDVMRLNELSSAFRQSGVYFEAVLFDACMMANIETAYAIHEYAHWMVASEELVAGQGTAIDAWLQQLISMPECDGEELGRWICDMTQIKYANLDNKSAQQLMTWSVIDLTKIERVAYYFDILFRGVRLAYQRSPEFVAECAKNIFQSEHYGGSHDNMLDLAGVFYRSTRNSMLSSRTRWEMIDALMDAVVYCVRGSGRAAARGLSFCYATDFLPEELDAYAENCPSANYLSLLDAISPWTAPDRVYKSVRRLPEMDTIDAYRVHVDRVMLEDGTPGFRLDEGGDINVGAVRFRMYRRDESTGVTTALGTAPAYCDTGADPRGVYRMPGFGTWPSIDGEICQIEALSIPMGGDYDTLYSIPIQINGEAWDLRCAYLTEYGTHTVYGLWEGFDSDSAMFNRNVMELSGLAGREYRLMYDIDGTDSCTFGAMNTLPRQLEVENAPLPAGTYYMEYIIYDIFMRPMKLARVELRWDGRSATVPDGAWEGSETLSVADHYASDD